MFKELLAYVLPKEIIESFDLVKMEEKEKTLHLFFGRMQCRSIIIFSTCVYPKILATLNRKNFISVKIWLDT